MTDIKFQICNVKTYMKRYKRSNGQVKESKTNTINLGSYSPFQDGDVVCIIDKNHYERMKDNKGNTEEIERLNTQIKELSDRYQEVEKKSKEQYQEIQELRKNNKNLQKSLNESTERKEELHNALHQAEHKISQKEKIILAYKKMGFWDRMRHYNPEQDIIMLESSTKNE
jgi:septal ring factor EnvC (AmiA/AmiB activator)